MRTGTKFIKLPIILFITFLLASCGSGGPTPEDTAVDVARKFTIHFYNEEYEEAGEYCLGSVYSYDVMRGIYEQILPEIEKHFDDVDNYLDAIDFDSPDIWEHDVWSGQHDIWSGLIDSFREVYGVEVVEGAERASITFEKGLDGSRLWPRVRRVNTIKHEGVWKIGGTNSTYLSMACWDKKFFPAEALKQLGIDE